MKNKNGAIDGGFLQGEYWQKFQESIGNEVFRESFSDGGFLAVKQNLPLGLSYFLVPRGPILFVNNQHRGKISMLVSSLIKLAEEQKVGWVKIEPQTEGDLQYIREEIEQINNEQRSKTSLLIVKSIKEHQPKQTLMVNLELNEEELIASFKSKTRYNIRLAGRKGVEIIETKNEKDIEAFLDLLEETAKRDGIKNYPREHYKGMLLVNSESAEGEQSLVFGAKRSKQKARLLADQDSVSVKLYLAKHEDDILAGAIVTYSGEVATYLHGASSNKKRNLMAPFGLHWEIMKQAKKAGYKKYDLGGTKLVRKSEQGLVFREKRGKRKAKLLANGERNKFSKVKKDNQIFKDRQTKDSKWTPADGSWQGITRFKFGFCPKCQPVEFPGGYDIIINKWKYKLYKFLQKMR